MSRNPGPVASVLLAIVLVWLAVNPPSLRFPMSVRRDLLYVVAPTLVLAVIGILITSRRR